MSINSTVRMTGVAHTTTDPRDPLDVTPRGDVDAERSPLGGDENGPAEAVGHRLSAPRLDVGQSAPWNAKFFGDVFLLKADVLAGFLEALTEYLSIRVG